MIIQLSVVGAILNYERSFQLANTPAMYHHPSSSVATADVPVTFLLSPIKELDSGSLNNTLHPNSPGTLQLAQALQTTGLATGGSPLSRIITVSSTDQCDTAVVSSQRPVLSVVIPTSSAAMAPADSSLVHETTSGSMPSRRRRFEVTRKESLNKSTSLDSGSARHSSKEAVEKRKSDGGQPSGADGKTGEVYV